MGGQYGRCVPFHVEGRKFLWYPASRFVYTEKGGEVSKGGAFNKDDAEREVRNYLQRISR